LSNPETEDPGVQMTWIGLTDEEWAKVAPHLPAKELAAGLPGRPWVSARAVFEAVLWVLVTGARWRDLPSQYPNFKTCNRRFNAWVEAGVLVRAVTAVAEDLADRGDLDLSECFIDGTFAPAKRGAAWWAQRNGARAAK
jgi:transposase